MYRTIVAAMALVALSACQPQRADKPLVKDARVRLAAVPGGPAGAYFTLEGGAKDDRLVRIDSAVVNKIELHESVMNGGVMTMRPIAEVQVPAGKAVLFAPGGSHAMLYGVDPRITAGTGVPMLFTFASGTRIEVEAKSVAAGDDMDGMPH
nr:copper chaperone PCu(A)C [Sphingomonas sp. Y57]